MRTYTVELDSGYTVEVEYERIEPELDYQNGTGTHGGVSVHAAYINLPDRSGNLVSVDVLHFLSKENLVDPEGIEEEIEENVYG
jgi:hypothetical protein